MPRLRAESLLMCMPCSSSAQCCLSPARLVLSFREWSRLTLSSGRGPSRAPGWRRQGTCARWQAAAPPPLPRPPQAHALHVIAAKGWRDALSGYLSSTNQGRRYRSWAGPNDSLQLE